MGAQRAMRVDANKKDSKNNGKNETEYRNASHMNERVAEVGAHVLSLTGVA